LSNEPVVIPKDTNLLQVQLISNSSKPNETEVSKTNSEDPSDPNSLWYMKQISIDPDNILTKCQKEKLYAVHSKYHQVFDGNLNGGYNGCSGPSLADFDFLNNSRPPVNHGKAPIYAREKDLDLLQAKIDELEEQGVVQKAAELGIVPRYAVPCMLVMKVSATSLKPGELEKMPVEQKIRYYCFILAFNQLNDYVAKIPSRYVTVSETIQKVGQFQHTIETDLTDSFFQHHVAPNKWPWMTFVSPHRGIYVMKRSAQGFLNSSEGLTELVSTAVGHLSTKNKCVTRADILWIGARTIEETISNWEEVLSMLHKNNLKLNPSKTKLFHPQYTILGHIKRGRTLKADLHKQLTITNTKLPQTVKELRSYLGKYKRFKQYLPKMAVTLGGLEDFQAGRDTKESLSWTENLKIVFEKSKKELKASLDNTYIPSKDDN
jgi:hypothetical protein